MAERGSPYRAWTPETAWTGRPKRFDLEAFPSEWDEGAAELLAFASMWSYGSVQHWVNRLAGYGLGAELRAYEICAHNPALFVDTNVFVLDAGAAALIAFRGTEPTNSVDFLTDAEVVLDPLPGDRDRSVHRAMYRAAQAVEVELGHYLERSRPRRVFVTGHSLGGGLAVLAAADLISQGRLAVEPSSAVSELVGVYTYGQPMVGNHRFRVLYRGLGVDERTYRHVYKRDLIPRLPPRWNSYEHVGREYRATELDGGGGLRWQKDGRVSRGTMAPAWFAVKRGLFAYYLRRSGPVGERLASWQCLFPFTLDDHAPDLYVLSRGKGIGRGLRGLASDRQPEVPAA